MAARPDAGPVRVFAYGSLVWKPEFDWTARAPGRIGGYRRAPCIWTLTARGTPDQPGLALGLDSCPTGDCAGIIFTLASGGIERTLEELWRREMHAGLYRPRWLVARTAAGPVHVLVFVSNREHPQYAGRIGRKEAAAIIRRARGTFGSCADYYRSTLRALEAEGLHDPELAALVAQVDIA